MVFSATNPSSAGSYTWKTKCYSNAGESGTAFTISGSQPTVTVNSALVAPTVSASKSTVDQGQSSSLTSTVVYDGNFVLTPISGFRRLLAAHTLMLVQIQRAILLLLWVLRLRVFGALSFK